MNDENPTVSASMVLTNDTLFAEIMNQMRHLGTLRFAMLGVYGAIVAGFLAVTSAMPGKALVGLRAFGVLVAVVFGFFEISLSKQHSRLAKHAIDIEGRNGPIFEGKKVQVFGPITSLTLLLYASSIAVWFGA